MTIETLKLRCASCGSIERSVGRTPPWAVLEAFGRGEWLDVGAPLPSAGDAWLPSDIRPLPGSKRHLKVFHPFGASSEAPFWATYVPGSAARSGLDDQPESIPCTDKQPTPAGAASEN